MIAWSTLLVILPVVDAVAHARPYQHDAEAVEARAPQVAGLSGFGGVLNGLSSLFGGLGSPSASLALTVPITIPSTSKTTLAVKSSSSTSKPSSSSAVSSASASKAASSSRSSSSITTPVVSAVTSKTSISAVLTGVSSIKTGSAATSSTSSNSAPIVASSSASKAILESATSASSVKTTSAASALSKASSVGFVASASSKTIITSSKTASGPVSSKAASSAVTPSSRSTSSLAATSSATVSASSTTGSLVGPSVTISAGTVVGSALGGGIDQFLGIPYAQPPVGALRLKPPLPLASNFGVLNATTPAPSCPQFAGNLTGNYSAGGLQSFINEFVFTPTIQQEDCLTVSVWRPNNTTPDSKLPVVFWIYGGGFEFGATAMYNGSEIVARSVTIGAPIIFVEANYRLGGFGFLAGADLAEEHSTNLGLRDQRLGLQWTADNIAAFGGDASKVTLWGESAGSISSCYQLTVNGGDNSYKGGKLFRGSIHNSGSFAPADNVTAPQAQAIYDQVVSRSGCTRATAADRLECLRSVDFDTLHNATNSVPVFGGYRSADLSYLPRPDTGDPFYATTAEFAVAGGSWTKTPFIIGDQEDEGTILAIVQNNITTNDDLVSYIASWFPGDQNALSDAAGLAALYPDNATAGQPDGSPYNTGGDNNVYPQYKRLAAILGDIVFIITRRAFLNLGTGQGIPAWSYISSYLQGLPTFGTLHGSDLAYLFDPLFANFGPVVAIQNYYISFIAYGDPNIINTTATALQWPTYNQTTPVLLEFTGGDPKYTPDTFRADVYEYLLAHVLSFRV